MKQIFDISLVYKIIDFRKKFFETYEKMQEDTVFLSQYISYIHEFDLPTYSLLQKNTNWRSKFSTDSSGDIAVHLAYENDAVIDRNDYHQLNTLLLQLKWRGCFAQSRILQIKTYSQIILFLSSNIC